MKRKGRGRKGSRVAPPSAGGQQGGDTFPQGRVPFLPGRTRSTCAHSSCLSANSGR